MMEAEPPKLITLTVVSSKTLHKFQTMNKKQLAFFKKAEKFVRSSEAKKLTTSVSDLGAKRLAATLSLAKIVSDGLDWFNLPETKEQLKALEIKMNVDEFVQQTYGFQKSFAYKLKRASDIPAELVEEYLASDIEERSLSSLLGFAKAKEESVLADLGADAEGGGESEGEGGGESESKSPIYVSLIVTDENGQQSTLRIRRNGKVETKGDNLIISEGFEQLVQLFGVPEAIG